MQCRFNASGLKEGDSRDEFLGLGGLNGKSSDFYSIDCCYFNATPQRAGSGRSLSVCAVNESIGSVARRTAMVVLHNIF